MYQPSKRKAYDGQFYICWIRVELYFQIKHDLSRQELCARSEATSAPDIIVWGAHVKEAKRQSAHPIKVSPYNAFAAPKASQNYPWPLAPAGQNHLVDYIQIHSQELLICRTRYHCNLFAGQGLVFSTAGSWREADEYYSPKSPVNLSKRNIREAP